MFSHRNYDDYLHDYKNRPVLRFVFAYFRRQSSPLEGEIDDVPCHNRVSAVGLAE